MEQTEKWVDAGVIAEHTGFSPDYIRKMAKAGKIPGKAFANGKKIYWRFLISQVDEAMKSEVAA